MRRLLLLAALLGGGTLAQTALHGVLTIRFLDVGQGDAVLITAPEGQSLLYDGGRSEKRMTELLTQYGVGVSRSWQPPTATRTTSRA